MWARHIVARTWHATPRDPQTKLYMALSCRSIGYLVLATSPSNKQVWLTRRAMVPSSFFLAWQQQPPLLDGVVCGRVRTLDSWMSAWKSLRTRYQRRAPLPHDTPRPCKARETATTRTGIRPCRFPKAVSRHHRYPAQGLVCRQRQQRCLPQPLN